MSRPPALPSDPHVTLWGSGTTVVGKRMTRIIIVGGGFGGVKCAQVLRREPAREQAELVLFDRENHLVFSPLLAEVAGSAINELDVWVPLRQLLPGIFCRAEEVRGVDFARNEAEYIAEDGQPARMRHDYLVLSCGNATNLNVVPGMADHAFPLKTTATLSQVGHAFVEHG